MMPRRDNLKLPGRRGYEHGAPSVSRVSAPPSTSLRQDHNRISAGIASAIHGGVRSLTAVPGHASQNIIALEDVVAQRSGDVNEHDCGKQVSKDHMRSLDPLTPEQSTVVTSGGTSSPSRSLVGNAKGRGTIRPVNETMNMSR